MKVPAFFTLTLVLAPASWAGPSPEQRDELSLASPFTYQGQLEMGGLPADGSFDFEFSLYDAREGGTFLGSRVHYEVPVTGGRFTAELDFATSVAGPEAPWLEVSVRQAAEFSFTPLRPRQRLETKAAACTVSDDLIVDGGRLGIGTAGPLRPLHIYTDPSEPQLRLEDNLGRWDIWAGEDFYLDKFGSDRLSITGSTGDLEIPGKMTSTGLRVEGGGRIGIERSNPQRQLHIYAQPGEPQIRLSDSGGYFEIQGGGAFSIIQRHLSTDDKPRLWIQGGDTGNVGIGFTAQEIDSKLKVKGRIHSTEGGYKFPDGTTQTTKAALTDVYQTSCTDLQAPNSSKTLSCKCLAGYDPLGGGWDSERNEQPGARDRDVHAYYNRPIFEGWQAGIRNDSGNFQKLTIFVICGKKS